MYNLIHAKSSTYAPEERLRFLLKEVKDNETQKGK